MTKWLALGTLAIVASALAANTDTIDQWGTHRLEQSGHAARVDSLLWSEDFENGWNGWEGRDLTALLTWHEADFIDVYAGDYSWWSGQEVLGGYDNHWLQFLETPAVAITDADAELSFQLLYATEGPGGEPAGYDAWDGCNVWISVDGGEWDVATGFSVPYTSNSLYSFGDEFGMGTGIPGWAGTNDLWEAVTLDLAAYNGSEVAFRFAFCADGGYCTADNPDIWGMLVDDVTIVVAGETVMQNDADGVEIPAPFTPQTVNAAGNTWTISAADSHSPSHAANGAIADGLACALVSPPFLVPTGYDVWFEFWIYCDMLDSDGDGNSTLEDYYHVQASADGANWTTLFYDYSDAARPGGTDWEDYVPGLPFNGDYVELRLNEWAGQEIQLRWRLTTDNNDDGGVGTGLWIDDVEVWGSDVVPNDLACTNIVPAYPRTEGVECPVFVEYGNFGSEWRNQVQAWMVANDNLEGPILPRMDIAPLSWENRVFAWTPDASGEFELKSYANNAEDMNTANDTLWVSPIDVLPAGQLEFGYSYSDFTSYWQTNDPAMFVSLEDDYGQGPVQLTDITIALYAPDDDFGGYTLRLHVMDDDGGVPGTELWTDDFTLTDQGNTAVLWSFEIGGEVVVDSDFWVWVEPLSNYPFPLGAATIWNYGHYALTDGIDFDLDFSDDSGFELMFFVSGEAVEGVDEQPAAAPARLALGDAYPNPFNPTTTLDFRAPAGSPASLAVYNLQGQLVATLFEGPASGAEQTAVFDGSSLASGVYMARLESGGASATTKLVLVK